MIRSRRAVSIIELIVVLSASTVVLTLSSVLLQRVMRIHIQSRADMGVEQTSLRLSDQFRRDVHQARSAVTDRTELGEKALLRLRFADNQQADYSYERGVLLRTAPKSDGRLAREEFDFPASSIVMIEQRGTPEQIILTIATNPDSTRRNEQPSTMRRLTIPASVHVEATLGRDWQFAGASRAPEAQK